MADLGKIKIIAKGAWISGNSYEVLDLVTYNGSSYIAKSDISSSSATPDQDSAHWQLVAAKGDKGDKGNTGEFYTS